ncbi:MAG: hypothetical protein WAL04_17000 [Acidimicrobiales bacterium]
MTRALHGMVDETRKLGVLALLALLSLAMGACTSTASAGVVTGTAAPCSGLATTAPGAAHATHVTVRLYSGQTLVASETIWTDAKYRFSVAPGTYYIKGPGAPAEEVVIRAGRVVTDNILNLCM